MTNHTVLGASGASTPQSVHSSWPKDYGWALPMGIVSGFMALGIQQSVS